MANRPTNQITVGDRARAVAPLFFRLLAALLWLVWQAIRLPLLTLLVLLEPFVSFVISALALIIALSALFWNLVDAKPTFPIWTILVAPLTRVLLLALYHELILLLSGSRLYPSVNLRLYDDTASGDTLRHTLTQEYADDAESTFAFQAPRGHSSLVGRAPGGPA
jgi:hypothetical protein